ncbi:hypothetical protein KP509_30G012900 [Ceratopteris richardii]|uniref:protein-serine/threonine phosphatase n=1 Tax=Ceratopteris richardii TaxID=49495 RepID=A0A8T2R138_CERRI|nr:hypothetical protein KP509_30G012900 [Ceratopteris richardii]
MQNTKPWVVKEKQAVSVPPTTAARRKRIEIRRFKMMSRPLRLLSDLTSGTKNCTCTKRARIDHNAAVLSSDDLMADASLSYSLNADELDLSGCSRIEEESRVSIEFPCVHEVCTSDRNARTEPSAAEDTSDTIPTSSLETVTSLVSTEAVSVISKGCNAPLDTDERGDMQTAISIDKPRDLALRSTSDSLSSRFSDNGMSITVDRSAVDTEADAVDMVNDLPGCFLPDGHLIPQAFESPSVIVGSRSCPPCSKLLVCGRRREMEDTASIVPFFTQSQQNSGGPCFCIGKGDGRAPCDVHFFAVYDGHGGAQASTFCMERMHCALAEELSSLFHDHGRSKENLEQSSSSSAWKKAMTACFAKVDREVGGVCPHGDCHDISKTTVCCEGSIAPENVGTTAVVAVVSASQIVVANCGDSRAILSRNGKVIVLSEDHKVLLLYFSVIVCHFSFTALASRNEYRAPFPIYCA